MYVRMCAHTTRVYPQAIQCKHIRFISSAFPVESIYTCNDCSRKIYIYIKHDIDHSAMKKFKSKIIEANCFIIVL